jgi:hypothetical protein
MCDIIYECSIYIEAHFLVLVHSSHPLNRATKYVPTYFVQFSSLLWFVLTASFKNYFFKSILYLINIKFAFQLAQTEVLKSFEFRDGNSSEKMQVMAQSFEILGDVSSLDPGRWRHWAKVLSLVLDLDFIVVHFFLRTVWFSWICGLYHW